MEADDVELEREQYLDKLVTTFEKLEYSGGVLSPSALLRQFKFKAESLRRMRPDFLELLTPAPNKSTTALAI